MDRAIIAVVTKYGPLLPSDINAHIDPYGVMLPKPSQCVWQLVDEGRLIWRVDRRMALPNEEGA